MSMVSAKGKFRARKDRFADVSRGHLLAEPGCAVLEAKDLRNSEENFGVAGGFHHLPAFLGGDRHGLLAQYGLAARGCDQHILQMASIWSGDEHSVNFRRAAQRFG